MSQKQIIFLFGAILFLSLAYILGGFFGFSPFVKKSAVSQQQFIKTTFSEKNTVFSGGKGTIGKIEFQAGRLVVTMLNPNYGGGAKEVESVYQKKTLILNKDAKIIEFFYIEPDVDLSPDFAVPQERQINLEQLRVGDFVDFISSEPFDFYGTEEIPVKQISKIR